MSQTRSSGPSRPRTSRTAPRRTGSSASRSAAPVLDPPEPTVSPPAAAASSAERSTASRPRSRARRARRAERQRGPDTTRRRTRRGPNAPGLSRPRALDIVRAPRHRLLVVCTAVLATGMLCVLLLNTMISQGAFRQHELELALIHASEADELLARQVQLAEAPLEVERRARALGMVPAAAPVFLRLSDGAILGEPVAAAAQWGKVSFAGAPGWQTPKPQASASPSGSAEAQPSDAAEAQPSGAAATQQAEPSAGGTPSADASGAATPRPTPTPTTSAGASPRPTSQEATP